MTIGTVLEQFIGFLLQVLPIALLGLVPFSDDALRLSRRKLIVIFSAGMVLLSVGFSFLSWLIFLPDGSHNQLLIASSNLYMMICVLLWIIAFFFLIRFNAIGKFVVLMLLIYYAAVLYIFNSSLAAFYNYTTQYGGVVIIYDLYTIVTSSISLAVTAPSLFLFLKRSVRFDLSYMGEGTLKRNCIYILFATLLFFVCVFSLSTFQSYFVFSELARFLFLLAFVLTDSALYFILFTEVRLTIRNSQLQDQLRSFNDQYHQISDNIARARRDRHDIRHHLNMISTLNHHGEQKKLEEYLQAYEASFLDLELMPLCGYPVFDNILQYYIEDARKYGIKVETEVQTLKEILDFDVIDLTVLLGNLMENAIEACCKLPDDAPRFIHIWAKQADVSFLLKIENSCSIFGDDQTEFSDGSSFLSKKHTSSGQGLKSVRFAAEKYGGSAEFKKTDGVFTARIVMNIP